MSSFSARPHDVRPAPSAAAAAERERVVRRLERLAYLMDARFRVPGTEFRVGLDGLLGMLPVAGDAASMAISLYIVVEAQKLDVPAHVTARMLGNIFLDAAVGTVPVLGDVFDMAFKANLRNLKLLGITPRW